MPGSVSGSVSGEVLTSVFSGDVSSVSGTWPVVPSGTESVTVSFAGMSVPLLGPPLVQAGRDVRRIIAVKIMAKILIFMRCPPRFLTYINFTIIYAYMSRILYWAKRRF